ncbi:MAG: acyltransferase [Erysipelotrichaceae bacterium]|nr:acyltransferase [Erysipelotrichaceae bacterium]
MKQTDLGPLIILFLIVLWMRIDIKDEQDSLFSLRNSVVLRGLLSLLVVFDHLAPLYGKGVIMPLFGELGFIAVGVFFFLSGYGLMKQNLVRTDYHKGFIRKRLFKILIPYLCFTILYGLYYLLIGEAYSVVEVLLAFVKGDPIVSYSWYIMEILLIYPIFYLSLLLCKKGGIRILLFNMFSCALLCLLFWVLAYRDVWYRSTYMYIAGLACALYEKQLIRYLKRYWAITMSFSLIFVFILYGQRHLFVLRQLCIQVLLMGLSYRFAFKNRFLEFTGSISLELYMVHGLVIKAVRRFISSEADLYGVMLILAFSYVGAWLMRILFEKIVFKRKI